ncbi:MAG: radical SAM family heme chaperone HemW [Proteobacteria bacterium]|nr:radical SAM family heme chaperone HemW [Pseudomonadota bacterium]
MGQCAGLYIHIPFCRKKCRYCDFYSIENTSLEKPFTDALKREMAFYAEKELVFDSLYLGGGTPSLISVDHLLSILEHATTCFHFLENREVTIEVNPGTVSLEKLVSYYKAGITRLNVGIQSFQDANLKLLGRIHTAEEGRTVIERARHAGYKNIGMDLIIGLPGQGRGALEADLIKTVSLHPEHISCYMLSYEAGTPFYRMREKGEVRALGDEQVGELYEILVEFLTQNGYEHYEISNFARIDSYSKGISYRSKHNYKYWSGAPYIGLGPSAHSFLPPVRFWNVTDIEAYISVLKEGRRPVEEEENLTPDQEMTEAIYLGLRTSDGIRLNPFRQKFGADFIRICRDVLSSLEKDGYLVVKKERLFLTRKGFLVSDAIVVKLMEEVEKVKPPLKQGL